MTPKLIRDKYIDIIEAEALDITDKTPEVKTLLILDKLEEEAEEFADSGFSDPKELADLMEVVVGWGEMNGFSFEEINKLREEKREKLGGFKDFVVLNYLP